VSRSENPTNNIHEYLAELTWPEYREMMLKGDRSPADNRSIKGKY
jgi:hypothetical protein